MRRCSILIMALLLGACVGRPVPTPTPRVQPAVDVAATVEASVKATVDAQAAEGSTDASGNRADGIRVEVIDQARFAISGGGTRTQGLVENTGSADASGVQVVVALFDDEGQRLGVGQTLTTPSLLRPGEKAAWTISISESRGEARDITTRVNARQADNFARRRVSTDFRTEGVSVGTGQRDRPRVSGQVINTGARAVTSVNLAIAVYDADGRLAVVDMTTARLGEIGAGQRSPFEFTFQVSGDQTAPPVEAYDIFVQGMPRP